VNGKPAVIVTSFPGAPHAPTVARLRARGQDPGRHPRGRRRVRRVARATGAAPQWRESVRREDRPALSRAENELIASENAYQSDARRFGPAAGNHPRRPLPRQRALGRGGQRRRDRFLLRLRRHYWSTTWRSR
jgi:hypothetical protein